jgi:bifunctional non-homologous end joining protein LigD
MATRKPGPAQNAARYVEKRDFDRTPEPAGNETKKTRRGSAAPPIFVVQKHHASRLHWDFRLEHDGALWSWAVPKGPSLDPSHKRLAVHVEDHPVEYATFEGTIPKGNYGAGTVEIWDRGTWQPVEKDAGRALARGELKFTLAGERLQGGFVLVRLKPKPRETAENWLLIKEHDENERPGADADALDAKPLAALRGRRRPAPSQDSGKDALPDAQAPQLAKLVAKAPTGKGWISEIKFDGYRILCRKQGDRVRIITRNGLDWTRRVPSLAASVAALAPDTLLLDGELVALDDKGLSSFALLQAAFSSGKTDRLVYYAFDLLHLDGRDLRPAALHERRAALRTVLGRSRTALRFSDHLDSDAARVKREACAMGLEGIVCKKRDAPYRGGRGPDWVKVKCENREEFIVLGATPPAGSRRGFGALQLGFHDETGALHYVGGCGTGFSARTLTDLAARMKPLAADRPDRLLGVEPPPRETLWVRPSLVVEVKHAGFTGGGMLRHAAFQGLREDKPAEEVVRAIPDQEAVRREIGAAGAPTGTAAGTATKARTTIVVLGKSGRGADEIGGQRLTHPDRALWPQDASGPAISKRDLAEYWQGIADQAAPGIVDRPLALLRCPDGIGGESFFQKHLGRGMPDALREGEADGAPYIAIDDAGGAVSGLVAAAQIAAVELHCWGSDLDNPLLADRLVFDLDPGDGVSIARIVDAAKDVKARLEQRGLAAFCRTSGGKGLHVLAPIRPGPGWDAIRAWCRSFAETMEAEAPDRYLSTTRKKDRTGRILVDWLRNGLGATAIASFSPRARPGAGVATPLAWREVGSRLDPAAFTLRTVPGRLARQKTDPWAGFADAARDLPDGPAPRTTRRAPTHG